MGMTKKMLALMLVVVLGLASAFTVSDATSPAEGNEKAEAVYPSTDKNSKDHNDKTVTSKVNKPGATV